MKRVAWCMVLVWLGELGAMAANTVVIQGDGSWDLTPHMAYAQEEEEGVMPPAAEFAPLDHEVASFGLVSTTYWFRVSVRNDGPDRRVVMTVNNPRLGLVEVWKLDDGAASVVGRVGDVEAETGFALGRRPPAFEVSLPEGEVATIFFRINHHGSLQFTASAWGYHRFLKHRAEENLLSGALCGAVGILLFYNILLLIQVRRLAYLLFTLFIFCYLFYMFALEGIGNDFLWRGHEWWAVRGVVFLFGLASLALHAFTRVFLGTKRRVPRWDRFIVGGMAVSAVVALGAFTWSLTISLLGHLLVIAAPFYILPAALLCWRGGYRPAGFFFLAWSMLMVCAAALSMVSLGWIPTSSHAETVVHLGFAAALALFSLALDSRARMTAARFRARLEHQVEERTAELREALDNVKTLSGMIPICSHCKKIRDDAGYWNRVEAYLQQHSDANLTHGICPECAEKQILDYDQQRPTAPVSDAKGEPRSSRY